MLKMNKIIVILVIITAVTAFKCGIRPNVDIKSRQKRIVNGQYTSIGEIPWAILILTVFPYREYIECGGALIAPSWGLTLRKCISVDAHTNMATKYYRLRLGVQHINSTEGLLKPVTISKIKVLYHPLPTNKKNPIILLKFDPIEFQPHIQPICLPTLQESKEIAGKMGTFYGFGKDFVSGRYSSRLLQARLPIHEGRTCQRTMSRFSDDFYNFTSDIFCAGYRHGKTSPCSADFGNGLQLQRDSGQWYLIGIMSRRPTFCRGLAIFNNLANDVPWIRRTMQALL